MRRLSEWILRLYPDTWQRRYRDEMSALLEDSRPKAGDAIDLLRGAVSMQLTQWSFWRTLLAFAVAGTLAGIVTAYSMREVFLSTAVLAASTEDLPEARRVLFERANEALRASNVERLILANNLYPEARQKTPLPELITRFRKAVKLRGSVRVRGRLVAQISFEYPDARKAAQITRLVSEQLAASSGTAVLEPANEPASPLYPNHKTISFAGLLGGLALGLPVAIIVARIRRRTTSGQAPLA